MTMKGQRQNNQNRPPRRLQAEALNVGDNHPVVDAVEAFIEGCPWMQEPEYQPMRELLRASAATVARYPDLAQATSTLRSVYKDALRLRPAEKPAESEIERLLSAV